MSPLFGSNDKTAVQWHLPRLLELGLLQEGEIMCEVEGAAHGTEPGVLVATDLAVLFVARSIFGSKSHVVAIALEDVESVEAGERSSLGRTHGTLLIARRRGLGDPALRDLTNEPIGRFAALLADGEVAVEVEGDAWLGLREGVLAVTNRRVAFFMGGVLRPNRCVASISFGDVQAVTAVPGEHGQAKLVIATSEEVGREWRLEFGVGSRERAEELKLEIEEHRRLVRARDVGSTSSVSELAPVPVGIEFEHIQGGRERAEQIASTIIHQKGLLSAREIASEDTEPEPEPVPEDPLPRVRLGRGVAAWVNRNGGRLYVWGDDFGDRFDRMRTSVVPPDGVSFVRTGAVTQFELHVESGMSWTRPMRLTRRWFGLLPGIAVDTGLVVISGA